MIIYAWYAARLRTACEVFCSVNQVAFLAEVKNKNASAASKHSVDDHGVANVCVFAEFMSIILNSASLSS
jgi:hypothetical protein